ncbi:MAG: S41 family peptidase [Chitinophagaceae bacterium]
MRFYTLLIFTASFFSQTLVGQEAVNTSSPECILAANRLVDEAFTLMKQHYYRKDSVQWDELISSVKTRLSKSTDCAAAQEALQWCFKEMKERHSFVMPAKKAEVYNGNINSSGLASLGQLSGPINYELVESDIAYINIPWLTSADKNICTAFADSIQQVIAAFDKQGVTKWIIDLRNNTGGNCWPMLAGLGPLLGNGVHGYFVSADEKIPFSYQDGAVMQSRHTRCTVSNPYKLITTPRSIVVLTGPNTASAGEIVAIAFKGRKNVQLYGEPTAGLTTANATYKLSDGSLLVLTVCKEADRHGNIFEGRIQPDQLVASIRGKDAVKSAALMFLQIE